MNPIGIPNLDKNLEATLLADMAKVELLLRSHIEGEYPLVIETSRHLVEAGGKRLRPLLTLIAAQFGDPTNYDIIKAAVSCELTHLATLYHDDVMDDALLRRGVTSANTKWGNAVAILTGDYLFSKVSDMLADIGPEAVKLQAKTFERLVIGQIKETQGESEGLTPIEHYLKVVSDKTGSLIATSARFGALLSGAEPEIVEILTKFGEKIGIAFQIADDLLDVTSDSTASGKTPGTDLKEGIPTLVTLYVMAANAPEDRELVAKLSGPVPENELKAVITQLRSHKALADVREFLTNIAREANELISGLPDGAAKEALKNVAYVLVNRTT
jgi:heptaprenyl diphosphate synthase